jgi:hypothetical protein
MSKARDLANAADVLDDVSATELSYVNGVTSAIQTQIDGKSGTSHNHDSTYVAKSLVDAKGDLLVGSANDTVSRLAVASTAGYVLTVDSAEATGVKWAAVAAGGKVLQVVYASTTTETTNNTTTYADTTLTANITPSSTSSRVLVMVVQGGCTKDAGSASAGFDMQVRRGSTGIGYFAYDSMKTSTAFSMRSLTFPMNIVDSPATTSSLTYKTQFRNMVSGSTVTVQSDGLPSTIVLLEIGA